jgi:hypothetical protein
MKQCVKQSKPALFNLCWSPKHDEPAEPMSNPYLWNWWSPKPYEPAETRAVPEQKQQQTIKTIK